MIDSEKREFMAVVMTTADLYDKTIKPERVAVYWEALKHRELADIKVAINKHVQDAERGRFFPLPADVSAQLPAERSLWIGADEAWAMCPKDDQVSAAVFVEMMQALDVANPLIADGDMIAARMAFRSAYERIVGEAKTEGRKPKWFPSLGEDKAGRHSAQVKAVEMTNLALPAAERLSLPKQEVDGCVGLEYLTSEAHKHQEVNEDGRRMLSELKAKLNL